jgi:hypothetical protein
MPARPPLPRLSIETEDLWYRSLRCNELSAPEIMCRALSGHFPAGPNSCPQSQMTFFHPGWRCCSAFSNRASRGDSLIAGSILLLLVEAKVVFLVLTGLAYLETRSVVGQYCLQAFHHHHEWAFEVLAVLAINRNQ